jgi:N-terminal domain of anti-restriction factor ArdC
VSGRQEQRRHRRRQSRRDKASLAPERDAQLQALHDSLVTGVRALVASDDWRAMLAMAARLHTYSWRNCLLILQQKPDATQVAGYRTWQSLGRQARRGEQGIGVLAPFTYRRAVECAMASRVVTVSDVLGGHVSLIWSASSGSTSTDTCRTCRWAGTWCRS